MHYLMCFCCESYNMNTHVCIVWGNPFIIFFSFFLHFFFELDSLLLSCSLLYLYMLCAFARKQQKEPEKSYCDPVEAKSALFSLHVPLACFIFYNSTKKNKKSEHIKHKNGIEGMVIFINT